MAERADEIAALITAENGKPAKWARAEVTRAVSTLRWSRRGGPPVVGELQRLDTDPTATGRLAVVRRFPRGPVLGISPFNFPLNLVAHKVAPGARGRRADRGQAGPGHAAVRAAAGRAGRGDRPAGRHGLGAAECPTTGVDQLVDDPRLPVVSFTGSGPVGWSLKERLPRKHVVLELGGNGAVVVAADYPDLDWAASRIATFSNYQAGQSCIAVQRVYVERPAYECAAGGQGGALAVRRPRRRRATSGR